jgi:hypothetical protein
MNSDENITVYDSEEDKIIKALMYIFEINI